MKISDQSFNHSAAAQRTAANANPPATTTANASAQRTQSSGVAVTVSNLARGLEKAARTSASDIDTQKVESVKAAIQDGTFTVNPEAIADKMLADAKEILQRTSN